MIYIQIKLLIIFGFYSSISPSLGIKINGGTNGNFWVSCSPKQWTCNGTTSYKVSTDFVIRRNESNGATELQVKNTNLCLRAGNGNLTDKAQKVSLYSCAKLSNSIPENFLWFASFFTKSHSGSFLHWNGDNEQLTIEKNQICSSSKCEWRIFDPNVPNFLSYVPSFPIKAIAVVKGYVLNKSTKVKSEISGTAVFIEFNPNGPVKIAINITGLPIGSPTKHGFHVHKFGISTASDVLSEICGSSGLHFDPYNDTHGDISSSIRHVGDLGNIVAKNGHIVIELSDQLLRLYGHNSIIGRTLVLHELEDDLGLGNNEGSFTTGNSGARIACGVIGIL